MSDFIPVADHEFLDWFDHFLAQISADNIINAADLAILAAANAEFHAKIKQYNNVASQEKQAVVDKIGCCDNFINLVRAEPQWIKSQSTYSDGQGFYLDIAGKNISLDLSVSYPELNGKYLADGVVVLNFSKYNSDGVNIYSMREGDTEWTLLHRASISPFMDVRPLLQLGEPESRRYSAIYILNNEEIGGYSHEVIINCTP